MFTPRLAEGEKAFPSDEFCLDDHWVRVDFMRQLGISYPDPSKETHFLVNEPASDPVLREQPQSLQQKATESRCSRKTLVEALVMGRLL